MRRWQEHDGTDCPVDYEDDVIVRFRNGKEAGPDEAWCWRWQAWPFGDSDWDIVAWCQP